MLVSLDKNKWLYDWMQENYQDDLYNIIVGYNDTVLRTKDMRSMIAKMLSSKGYKTKVTSKHDIIISMTEEEYILLKLKYQ
jgi:hypothetical protein